MALEKVHWYGVLRNVPGWEILNDGVHEPAGFTGLSVDLGGHLVLTFPRIARIHCFTITSDEIWAGKYTPGASVGYDRAIIHVRNYLGTLVNASTITGGNFWVDFTASVEVPEPVVG